MRSIHDVVNEKEDFIAAGRWLQQGGFISQRCRERASMPVSNANGVIRNKSDEVEINLLGWSSSHPLKLLNVGFLSLDANIQMNLYFARLHFFDVYF
jgi:hypothetical protein